MQTVTISVHRLDCCYACGAKASGLRDRRPEGGEVEPACPRHAEPRLIPKLVCALCSEPVRKGSLVIDGEHHHKVCFEDSSRDYPKRQPKV